MHQYFDAGDASSIPEPATSAMLFGAAALGLIVVRTSRRFQSGVRPQP
jgi:hypothetical protein